MPALRTVEPASEAALLGAASCVAAAGSSGDLLDLLTGAAVPGRVLLLLAAVGPLCVLLSGAAVVTEAYAVAHRPLPPVPRVGRLASGAPAARTSGLPPVALHPLHRPVHHMSKSSAESTFSATVAKGTERAVAAAALLAVAAASLVAFLMARVRSLGMGLCCAGTEQPEPVAAWTLATVGAAAVPESAAERVDAVLRKIRDSDAGANLSKEDRGAVDGLLASLEDDFASAQPRPIANPQIFDNYRVSYVSVGRDQVGNPAGGRWRGAVGKALFRTTGLYQNLLPANVVVNVVAFRFLSCLRGCVVLKGTFAPTEQPDFVRATFQSPRLCFAIGGLKMAFEIGPPSAVELNCAYLDDRVRLGKGSRGSRFVFERTKDAQARVWEEVMALRPIPALLIPLAVAAFLAGAFYLVRSNVLVGAAGLAVIGLYLLVARNGGIIDADTAIAPEAS
eukprot:EG_transcript_7993